MKQYQLNKTRKILHYEYIFHPVSLKQKKLAEVRATLGQQKMKYWTEKYQGMSFIFCLPAWKLSKMFFLSCFHKIWNIKEKTTRSMTNICYLFYFSEELQQLTDTRSKQSWDQSLTATTKAEFYTTHQMKSSPGLETRLGRRRRWRETASRSSRLRMMPISRLRWIRRFLWQKTTMEEETILRMQIIMKRPFTQMRKNNNINFYDVLLNHIMFNHFIASIYFLVC